MYEIFLKLTKYLTTEKQCVFLNKFNTFSRFIF